MTTKEEMVERHLKKRGISDERVLKAFKTIPREEFVLDHDKGRAYSDSPLPIGFCQTISQPYIVALTVESMKLEPDDLVLELGTGSGYEAAVLSLLCTRVVTVERIPELAEESRGRFKRLGYSNIEVITGDGTTGYPEHAPYNGIAVSAAAPSIPESLVNQLTAGGRMVIPVGRQGIHRLMFLEKDEKGIVITKKNICDCRFVPLIGEEGFKEGER